MSSQVKPVPRGPAEQGIASRPAPVMNGSGKIALSSYGVLSGAKGSPGAHLRLSEGAFKRLLGSVLDQVKVDEAWYARFYPDVGEAIGRGEIASAKRHYVKAGYFEDRMPKAIGVDTEWYLNKYQDVRRAVAEGKFASAQEHFERFGFREGRLPYADWSLCD